MSEGFNLVSVPSGDIGTEYYLIIMLAALVAMAVIFIIGKKRK